MKRRIPEIAITVVMFVALTELGYKLKLLVGECYKDGTKPFDHSWIELDNKTMTALNMPLTEYMNNYPIKGGLWRALEMVYPSNDLNIQSLKNNYLKIYIEIVS